METEVQVFLHIYLTLVDKESDLICICIICKVIIICKCSVVSQVCTNRIRVLWCNIAIQNLCLLCICANVVCKDKLLPYHLVCPLCRNDICVVVINTICICSGSAKCSVSRVCSILHCIVIYTLIDCMAAFLNLCCDVTYYEHVLVFILFCSSSNYCILNTVQRNLLACFRNVKGSRNSVKCSANRRIRTHFCVICILTDCVCLACNLDGIADFQCLHCKCCHCSAFWKLSVQTCVLTVYILLDSILVTL